MRVVCIDVSVQWCSKVAVVLLFSIVTQVEKNRLCCRTRTHSHALESYCVYSFESSMYRRGALQLPMMMMLGKELLSGL